jgi:uncharacterized protein YecE (DUF72 family)
MGRDEERLDTFLAMVPPWIRIAMELHHPSWNDPVVDEIHSRHRAAYVVTDGLGLDCIPKATTDFVYVRMDGPDSDPPYAGSYSTAVLHRWADQIAERTRRNRRVLVYFKQRRRGTYSSRPH